MNLNFFRKSIASKPNIPINRKGAPRPREYAKSEGNAVAGFTAARVRIEPSTAPIQGDQPIANVTPNIAEVINWYIELRGLSLYSFCKKGIFIFPRTNRPKIIIMIPPIRETQERTS